MVIEQSRKKIERTIKAVFAPVVGQDLLWSFFKELQDHGINIENKDKVLSLAASEYEDIDSRKLYRSYCAYKFSLK